MPLYEYQHPETGEIKEVFQKMKDEHIYVEDGVEWKRVFGVPHAAIDTQLDPFSQKDFVNKTSDKKGTMGDILDLSTELSEKRADKAGGEDPVKRKHFDDYKKKNGVKHMKDTKKKISKGGISVEF